MKGVKTFIIISCLLMTACVSSTLAPERRSGYLPNELVDQMRPVKVASGQKVYRYVSPNFNPEYYRAAYVNPTTIYPSPKSTDQVTPFVLKNLKEKVYALIKGTISTKIPVSANKGGNVLNIHSAVTGVNVSNKPLKPYQYIPVALVRQGINTAIGGRDQQVIMYVETKVTDSVTDEILFLSIREIPGEDLENAKVKLEASILNKGIDEAAKDIAEAVKGMY